LLLRGQGVAVGADIGGVPAGRRLASARVLRARMLSAVRTTAYSVIAVGGRRSGASRCAATPRPRPLLEHFSLNQLCQLDATAYEPIHPALATARIVLAWRM